jgi:hypothetical protein
MLDTMAVAARAVVEPDLHACPTAATMPTTSSVLSAVCSSLGNLRTRGPRHTHSGPPSGKPTPRTLSYGTCRPPHTHTHTHTHPHTLSLSLSLSLCVSRARALSLSHTHTRSLSRALSLSRTLSLALSLSLTHTYTCTYIHKRACAGKRQGPGKQRAIPVTASALIMIIRTPRHLEAGSTEASSCHCAARSPRVSRQRL